MRKLGSLISTYKNLRFIALMIIIMTITCYKSGKLMITTACYESGNNNDESDNNEDKVYSLLRR